MIERNDSERLRAVRVKTEGDYYEKVLLALAFVIALAAPAIAQHVVPERRRCADLRSRAAHHRLRSFVFSAFSRSVQAAIRVDRAIHA